MLSSCILTSSLSVLTAVPRIGLCGLQCVQGLCADCLLQGSFGDPIPGFGNTYQLVKFKDGSPSFERQLGPTFRVDRLSFIHSSHLTQFSFIIQQPPVNYAFIDLILKKPAYNASSFDTKLPVQWHVLDRVTGEARCMQICSSCMLMIDTISSCMIELVVGERLLASSVFPTRWTSCNPLDAPMLSRIGLSCSAWQGLSTRHTQQPQQCGWDLTAHYRRRPCFEVWQAAISVMHELLLASTLSSCVLPMSSCMPIGSSCVFSRGSRLRLFLPQSHHQCVRGRGTHHDGFCWFSRCSAEADRFLNKRR